MNGLSGGRTTSLNANRKWAGSPVEVGARAVGPAISPQGPVCRVSPLTWSIPDHAKGEPEERTRGDVE
eukprot:4855244-Prymnesium_polylepis.1